MSLRLKSLLLIPLLVIFSQVTPVFAKNVQDFYFENFTADYYVSRDENGVSHMKVVETLEAVFPDYNQNLGIVRYIPYINQGGTNTTIPSKSALNLSVTRNGEPEPIYNIDREDGYYAVGTGDDTTYLHGHQTFVLTYYFEKVITDFQDHQELYWDTNGNHWPQEFKNLTARVHFTDAEYKSRNASLDRLIPKIDIVDGRSACYVGRRGSTNGERCTIKPIEDGYEFTTEDLAGSENLTFVIGLNADSFTVPIDYNYTGFAIFVGATLSALIIVWFAIKKYRSVRDKRSYYRSFFVAPQYQPHPELTVGEVAENSIPAMRDSRTASLIALAVNKNITIIRGKKRALGGYQWSIKVNELRGIPEEQFVILQIINGGTTPVTGDEIRLKSHSYTSTLESLGRKYTTDITASLKKKGFREPENTHKKSSKRSAISALLILFVAIFAVATVIVVFAFSDALEAGVPVGGDTVLLLAFLVFLAGIITSAILRANAHKFALRTEKGLAASRYTEGLKLYMQMAESERVKFLQSVEGADTSPEGIVKLYEKLLPYAIIFGLENSWMKELNHYYEMTDMPNADWYIGAAILSSSDFHQFVSSSSSNISHSITDSSSSSGFSGGGGGGGFSGGGGGGGGGGGR